jgi:hypothetical protein
MQKRPILSTLVLSNNFWTPKDMEITCSPWRHGRPSAEGFDIVILNLFFGTPSKEGYCEVRLEGANFYELGIEILKSLRAGGVTIALMGPVTVTNRDLSRSYAQEVIGLKECTNKTLNT